MRVLFIGLGGVGQRHMRNILKISPKSEIFAVRQTNKNFEIDNNLNVDYSTNIMGLKKYYIRVSIKNKQSIKLINKLGFIQNTEFVSHDYSQFILITER